MSYNGAREKFAALRPVISRLKIKKRTPGVRLRESEEMVIKGKSPAYIEKVREAEDAWQARAQRIKAGEIQNTWDLLEERGFIKDITGSRETLRELMRIKRVGAYVGIDPTAPSLHIGHLIPLMPLFWMYLHGYQAVSLVGGSTAKIGDPTDRLKSRPDIARVDMAMNIVLVQAQLKKLWKNAEERGRSQGFTRDWAWVRGVVNNNAWWNSQPMLEVLRRVGTSLRIGAMLTRDTVRQKMVKGDGVSFAEFTYPIMQGWDWFQLLSQRGIQMQIGGSDQFGNIVAGIDVVKAARASDKDPNTKLPAENEFDDPVGFTVPLLTDSSGAKFGKSAGNAIWLDQYKTSVYDFYGYFIRRPDADVEQLLKLFTFLPMDKIREIMADHSQDPSQRIAQHALALEVATFVHGDVAAAEARDQHRLMHGKPTSAPAEAASQEQYQSGEKQVTWNNAPRADMILPESLVLGKSISRILFATGLASSISEGHRLAKAQGVYIGGAPGVHGKAMNPSQLDFTTVQLWYPQETKKYLIDGKLLILRKGKHNIRVIKVVSDQEYTEAGEKYPGMPLSGAVRKLNEHLTKLRAGLSSVNEVGKQLASDRGEIDPNDILVFPEDKSEQRLELEAELLEEINKKQAELDAAMDAEDAELLDELEKQEKPRDDFEKKDGKASS